MRVGVAHHLGWAVVVSSSADHPADHPADHRAGHRADHRADHPADHRVVDRRRIELVGEGLPAAPIHHAGGTHELHRTGPRLDDDALADLVARVRGSAVEHAQRELAALAADLDGPVESLSLRAWPDDFPTDIATLRLPPHESRADSVMYRAVLAEVARGLGWRVVLFDAATVEAEAAEILGDRARDVLHGPRDRLGPPWTKDHRIALAATVCVG